MKLLKTNISVSYWCGTNEQGTDFEKARIELGHDKPTQVSWLDELFKSGLVLQGGKPLTLLLAGPPGSGKTTLALELCYRFAINLNLFSLYISTESDTYQVIKNADSYGWKDSSDVMLAFSDKEPRSEGVAVWGADKIKNWDNITQLVEGAVDALKAWFSTVPESVLNKLTRILVRDHLTEEIINVCPDILVIDSLNILKLQEQGDAFQKFLRTSTTSKRPSKLIVFVLDSEEHSTEHKFWEYVSDIVLRLDHLYQHDYYERTIEILKARYQEHVWGKHQLKIYPKYQMPEKNDPNYYRKLRRSHPYRDEGGIFIYPSIHYYLSACKRKAPTREPKLAETLPIRLNDVLKDPKSERKGIPEGRCTAFIGSRGGHKSHLGYLHLLHRIIKHKETALIISLRDDEEMTKKTMQAVIHEEFKGNKGDFQDYDNAIDELENKNFLEILYYPPGYITSEEFIHRMLMSIYRLKLGNRKLTILFNSLDQLGARFPLCAKQEIFVPGLIEILSAEGITSIFIAVTERGQPEEQYGLLPMADLILSFRMESFSFGDYYKHLKGVWDFDQYNDEIKTRIENVSKKSQDCCKDEIELQVVRFAGGQRAGAKGILELVNEHQLEDSLYERPGLHLTPLLHQIKA